MFEESKISPQDVASVTIGTTVLWSKLLKERKTNEEQHFVNAVVEMDRSRLARVAVIRLCGPFSKHAPPCVDWPRSLKEMICGHYALLKGGLQGK